jgi:transaldolase/glucose-6-phosphate isomerase
MEATSRTNQRLAALTAAGTSVWLDQVRRSLTRGGELERLVHEDCLRGETSNPAIFNQAILGSDDYDDQLEQLAREGLGTREIYQAIAILDIQEACDVLAAVYDETDGRDGFVSLEVDPDLAFDTRRTEEQAREYWSRVDRPNVMIKIPGTEEGFPAIEAMTYEGRNINVTLLFGVENYTRCAEAYIRGLERRLDEGKPIDRIASVASFFVSRVDTEVDKRLKKLGREDLRGKAGIANARAAYLRFKEIFSGERWDRLQAAGAQVQRPLWASTGVKDPAYPDTMYVDNLVGPHTVNTMPMATLIAAGERAEPKPGSTELDPTDDLRALREAGIDLEDVTAQLLREGVEKFVDPMEALLAGIDEKREAIVTRRPPTISASLPDELEHKVASRLDQAAAVDVARRIWKKDDTLWGPAGQPEVADRLGWLTVTEQLRDDLDELLAFARAVRDSAVQDVVLLGMGGSSLAPEVFRESFGRAHAAEGRGSEEGWPTLHVLDSTDPDWIRTVEEATDPQTTLHVVSTKSGGTIETLSLFERFWARRPEGDAFIAITDPGSGLQKLASERSFKRTFLNDPDIGGRYSALSYFGLVPAALMGADLAALLDGAAVAEAACSRFDSPQANSGLWLGCTLGELALQGRDKLTMVAPERIAAFELWAEQLIAESTGKQGRGIVPVALERVGAPEDYGDDRVFVQLRDPDAPDERQDAQVRALGEAGHPVITVNAHGPNDLGRIFFFAEFATAVAGWALQINPFDQPNVQEAKDNTKKVLARIESGEGLQEPQDAGDEQLRDLLADLAAPGYLAILGYLPASDAIDAAVAELRETVRAKTKATTTFGYGPRYLHSTGQLHKGGPPTGRFLVLVHDPGQDVEIGSPPTRPYTFGQLERAQAVGDIQTLQAHGRPVAKLTLRGDPAAALGELSERVRRAV